MNDPTTKAQLKAIRLEMESWFEEMDKKVNS
jgi:hypothetical protein